MRKSCWKNIKDIENRKKFRDADDAISDMRSKYGL